MELIEVSVIRRDDRVEGGKDIAISAGNPDKGRLKTVAKLGVVPGNEGLHVLYDDQVFDTLFIGRTETGSVLGDPKGSKEQGSDGEEACALHALDVYHTGQALGA
jgi:hypothetical protein